MATKAKKSTSAKKSSKASKPTKSVKASPAKKSSAAKAKNIKSMPSRSKTAKKPSKASSKKLATKPTAKSPVSSKRKVTKPIKLATRKASSSKKTASSTKTAKPKTTAKKASIGAGKQGAAGKSAPKLATVKHEEIVTTTAKPAKKPTEKKKSVKAKENITHMQHDVLEDILPYQERLGEEYMNKKQQEHFRAILLQRKKEFMDEMERTVHHLQDEAANFPDPNDRATQEEEFGLVLRTRDRELKYIKNIEDALQRIDEGEYGYCEACGVEIGVRRLEARPTATLCIDCKTLDEIREKQMGG